MVQLEHIEAIERRLWGAADKMRGHMDPSQNKYVFVAFTIANLSKAKPL